MTGQVEINGAPGGLIATILKAPEQAGILASLEASGTLMDWQISADAAVGEQSVLDLDASRLDTGYAVQGQLDLVQLGQLTALKVRLGDQVTFRGTLDAQNRLSGEINAETITTSFSGLVRPADKRFSIEDFKLEASGVNAGALTGQTGLDAAAVHAAGTRNQSHGESRFGGEFGTASLA